MGKIFALSHIILKVGDVLIHKNLGYEAEIKSITLRGNGKLLILDTPQNSVIWQGYKLPKLIDAKNIAKHFKQQIFKLDL